MGEHIFEIIGMLLLSAIFGFFIAWFWNRSKFSTLETYINTLEDKNNRLQTEFSDTEKKLIDCQTERKKIEVDIQTIEKLLGECQGKLIVSDVNLIKKDIDCEDEKNEQITKESKTKKEIALERIKAKAEKVNFSRIGNASEENKNDLKLIKGIGPFIEQKLNTIGIFTFKQIANFTDEDKETVNEVIEFFPGRIKRDDWVGQAKLFIK